MNHFRTQSKRSQREFFRQLDEVSELEKKTLGSKKLPARFTIVCKIARSVIIMVAENSGMKT